MDYRSFPATQESHPQLAFRTAEKKSVATRWQHLLAEWLGLLPVSCTNILSCLEATGLAEYRQVGKRSEIYTNHLAERQYLNYCLQLVPLLFLPPFKIPSDERDKFSTLICRSFSKLIIFTNVYLQFNKSTVPNKSRNAGYSAKQCSKKTTLKQYVGN